MRLGLSILSLVVAIFSATLEAQTSPYPHVWRKAQGLEVGQSLFTFSANTSRYSKQLTSGGASVSLGAPYTQAISWGEIIEGAGEETGFQKLLSDEGLSADTLAVSSRLQVSQELVNLVPQWAYGLTSRWTVGVRVPVIFRRTRISANFEMADDYQRIMTSADDSAGVDKAELSARASDALERKLRRNNYDPLRSEQTEWMLGDAELLSKWGIWKAPGSLLALRQRVVLPTAPSKSPYRYVEAVESDGQLDVGMDALWDYWLGKGWLLTGNLGYTWQAPDQIRARLPREGEGISRDVDLEVERDLGDYWSASLFAEHSLAPRWRVLGGYSYRNKARDSYSGGGFSPSRYENLSRESEQELHMAHAGLSFRGEPISRRRGLTTEFATSLYLSTVLAGHNVPDTSLAGIDLQLQF